MRRLAAILSVAFAATFVSLVPLYRVFHANVAPNAPRGDDAVGATVSLGANTAWSGWIDVAHAHVAFRSVAASFRVPAVICTAPGAAVALWAGLDGYPHGNPTIEQAGVAADCVKTLLSGIYPRYFAWYQMGPDGPVIENAVKAGDLVSVSVLDDRGTGQYQLRLIDRQSPAADIRVFVPCPTAARCDDASAEVIAEDPGGGYSTGSALANFGVASFSGIRVTSADGTVGGLQPNGRWSVQGEAMVDGSDNLVAEPSGRTDDCTAFTVTYTPDLI